MRLFMWSMAAAAVVCVFGGTAQATPERPSPPAVILYDGQNFTGTSTVLTTSARSLSATRPSSMAGRTSSVRITGGMRAALYIGSNFGQGRPGCLTVSSDQATLPEMLDNEIYSVKVNHTCSGAAAPASKAPYVKLLHDNISFGTETHIVSDNVADLSGEDFDAKANRAIVTGPYPVALYTDKNFGGTCLELFAGQNDWLGNVAGRVRSVHVGAQCGDALPAVVLYEDAGFKGSGVVLHSDVIDLHAMTPPFEGVSSVQLVGGLRAAALYSGKYGGSCETFTASDPWLGDNWMGDNNVGSLRVGWTCAGPAPGPSYIDDLQLLDSPAPGASCPAGYDRKLPDLNESIGGAHLALCARHVWVASPGAQPPYTGLRVHTVWASDVAAGLTRPACEDVDAGPGPEWSILQSARASGKWERGNLNAGSNLTTGVDGIFLCTREGGTGAVLEDVRLVTRIGHGHRAGTSTADIANACNTSFGDSSRVWAVDDDLNAGVAGDAAYRAIFVCALWSASFAGDPPGWPGIDATPPTVAITGRTAPNGSAGWNTSPVTLAWTCEDQGTTSKASFAKTLGGEADGQTVVAVCVDRAGNTARLGFDNVRIDRTPPEIAHSGRTPPNAEGWNDGDVRLEWQCSDGVSGPAAATIVAIVTGEGAGLSATGECSDRAGLKAGHTVEAINIDRTPPVVVYVKRTPPNERSWNSTIVEVMWRCIDGVSGARAHVVTSFVVQEGAGQAATGQCVDRAGNTADGVVGGINVDLTPPSARIEALLPVLVARPGSDLTGTATDNLSGVGEVVVELVDASGAATTRSASCVAGCGTASMHWRLSVEGLTPGLYEARAAAGDVAGNRGDSSDARKVLVVV